MKGRWRRTSLRRVYSAGRGVASSTATSPTRGRGHEPQIPELGAGREQPALREGPRSSSSRRHRGCPRGPGARRRLRALGGPSLLLLTGTSDANSVIVSKDGNNVDAVCFYFDSTTQAAYGPGSGFSWEGNPVGNSPHNDGNVTGNADVSIARKPGGVAGSCTDIDDNATDFKTKTPATPRSTKSPITPWESRGHDLVAHLSLGMWSVTPADLVESAVRSLRLKNFRSFGDTGRLELRPLTVLVGANSSGKSSFLRFFPLLRQTFEAKSASPLLWYGRYVDFGDFSQALRRGAEPKEITVEIETTVTYREESLNVTSTSILREGDGKTETAEWSLSRDGSALTMAFDPSGKPKGLSISAGGKWLRTEHARVGPYVSRGSLLPEQLEISGPFRGSRLHTEPHAPLHEELSQQLGTTLIASTIEKLSKELRYGSAGRMLDSIEQLQGGKTLRAHLRGDQEAFDRVRSYAFVGAAHTMLESASRSLEAYGLGCVYIGPFRAAPERFYRLQELSVSQLEPHGENLAMFLRSLSKGELESFSTFAAEHVGFRVVLHAEGSHVAVLLQDDAGQAFNLIDMGYGFSQVLPVIAQCWATASGRRASEREPLPTVLAIEQPELHLHPYYQARLADMFVGTMGAVRSLWNTMQERTRRLSRWGRPPDTPSNPPQFIVETHSDALVSRLGELVEAGKLASDDVVLLLFEQDQETKLTSVRQSTFSPDGTLTNWPVGFFAP